MGRGRSPAAFVAWLGLDSRLCHISRFRAIVGNPDGGVMNWGWVMSVLGLVLLVATSRDGPGLTMAQAVGAILFWFGGRLVGEKAGPTRRRKEGDING